MRPATYMKKNNNINTIATATKNSRAPAKRAPRQILRRSGSLLHVVNDTVTMRLEARLVRICPDPVRRIGDLARHHLFEIARRVLEVVVEIAAVDRLAAAIHQHEALPGLQHGPCLPVFPVNHGQPSIRPSISHRRSVIASRRLEPHPMLRPSSPSRWARQSNWRTGIGG